MLSGKKKSDIDIEAAKRQCTIIKENFNPISLLKHFDKVYTKTSQMGFEALLVGCECVCFGMPFYAGWGVTVDRVRCERRKAKRSVEEIFAAAYILYTRYYTPYRNCPSNIFDTIAEIVQQKNKPNNNVLVLGDSHIRVFEHWIFRLLMRRYHFHIAYVPGATAYGIANRNSQTNAYNIFYDALNRQNYRKIIVTLGEVDTAYTLWSIIQRDKKDIDEVLNVAIKRYIDFLKELSGYAQVIVLSASLPTISDLTDCDDSVQGIRKKVDISQRERTALALRFNASIKEFCSHDSSIEFCDFDRYALNPKTQLVRSWLLNKKNPCDHHYRRWVYALLILWRLKGKF